MRYGLVLILIITVAYVYTAVAVVCDGEFKRGGGGAAPIGLGIFFPQVAFSSAKHAQFIVFIHDK